MHLAGDLAHEGAQRKEGLRVDEGMQVITPVEDLEAEGGSALVGGWPVERHVPQGDGVVDRDCSVGVAVEEEDGEGGKEGEGVGRSAAIHEAAHQEGMRAGQSEEGKGRGEGERAGSKGVERCFEHGAKGRAALSFESQRDLCGGAGAERMTVQEDAPWRHAARLEPLDGGVGVEGEGVCCRRPACRVTEASVVNCEHVQPEVRREGTNLMDNAAHTPQ